MGRPRTPTAILELQGDCTPSRHGYRGAEPKPEGEPKKPLGLPLAASDHWDEHIPRLVKMGVARSVDAPALEIMCRWWARMKELETQEPDYRNLTLLAMCSKQWKDYASRFGMTPSDRAKLSTGSEEDHDPAAKYCA